MSGRARFNFAQPDRNSHLGIAAAVTIATEFSVSVQQQGRPPRPGPPRGFLPDQVCSSFRKAEMEVKRKQEEEARKKREEEERKIQVRDGHAPFAGSRVCSGET